MWSDGGDATEKQAQINAAHDLGLKVRYCKLGSLAGIAEQQLTSAIRRAWR